jgi:hypothetical protein
MTCQLIDELVPFFVNFRLALVLTNANAIETRVWKLQQKPTMGGGMTHK